MKHVVARMFWLLALAAIVYLYLNSELGIASLIAVLVITNVLTSLIPGDEIPTPPSREQELDASEEIKIYRSYAKRSRDLLMLHHTMRGTDKAYQDSKMAADTNRTIAYLNVLLENKAPQPLERQPSPPSSFSAPAKP